VHIHSQEIGDLPVAAVTESQRLQTCTQTPLFLIEATVDQNRCCLHFVRRHMRLSQSMCEYQLGLKDLSDLLPTESLLHDKLLKNLLRADVQDFVEFSNEVPALGTRHEGLGARHQGPDS